MDDQSAAARAVEPVRRIPSLADDVRRYLLGASRSLPPKYFYDERGSLLFDRICDTKEYYPTRLETALLEASAPEIVRRARPDHIFELGSGTSRKTRALLRACQDLDHQPEYWPLDVSEGILEHTAVALRTAYPWLAVNPLVGDYSGGLGNLPAMPGAVLCLFLGGTIGNFPEREAEAFLLDLADQLNSGDHLLIGFDRVKDPSALEAAYNDDQGLTAEFNRNMLNVINRALGADFDPDDFDHHAVFNQDDARIEMYLVARSDMIVRLPVIGETLSLAAGERILTEISRKFTRDSLEALLAAGGFDLEQRFDAPEEWYSLALARKG
jgi:L-histidine N-alpha-methyltransferase